MPDQSPAEVMDPVARFEALIGRENAPETPELETAPEQVPEAEAPEEEAEPVEGDPQETPEVVEDEGEEVEYSGKTYKVPKELKDALLRQDDYTRKTQEVAERRRQLEEREAYLAAVETIRTQAFDKAAELKQVDATLKQFEQLDWNAVAEADTTQFLKLDRQFRALKDKRQEILGEMQAVHGQLQAKEQERMRQMLDAGQKELAKRIPGFGPETSKKLIGEGRAYGFEETELRSVIDPRMLHVLHDAIKWRELQGGKSAVQKKVAQAKPMQAQARSSTTQQVRTENERLRTQLKKTGSGDVATELFRRRLEAASKRK